MRAVKPDFLFLSLRYKMKYKLPLFFLLCFVAVIFLFNSCKKDNSASIQTLFTKGKWQLASIFVFHYVGAEQTKVDTLNTNCNETQIFTFNADNTCSYTNFDCLSGTTATGHWTLQVNQVFFNSDMMVQDTTAAKSSQPFSTAKIVNLGLYSMVLQTGSLQVYYPPTQVRSVTQYGFVRIKTQ